MQKLGGVHPAKSALIKRSGSRHLRYSKGTGYRDSRDLKKKEGERMSKLQDIYQRAYNNTPAATVDDNTVGEAVREQIEREKSRAGGTLSEDEWSDLVCLGTSYGQAQGFESGFRYALALIFESLSN
ncbi:hypothetical protein [[Ruminococcus] torques]|jgi:hypothetical protein|uniref:hypothetical protein n=1 Tax=[Ruminococcus] torques TaxID=33039 RepID=UPI0027B893A3|nr:hypothetical protein [[Ruminococcus] torques]